MSLVYSFSLRPQAVIMVMLCSVTSIYLFTNTLHFLFMILWWMHTSLTPVHLEVPTQGSFPMFFKMTDERDSRGVKNS